MANIKIVQLDEALTLDDADVLAASDVSELETKKITVGNFRTVMVSGLGLQQAYDVGQTIDIEAAKGPIMLDVPDGEGTALQIDTAHQSAPPVRIVGASLPSTRTKPLLELADNGANPAPLITLADLGGVKAELWSEKIRGVGNLIIEGANNGSVGASGTPIIVRGGDGATGDGVTQGGTGGTLTLRSGQAGSDGGAGRGGAGSLEIAVPFTAPVTANDGNIVVYTGAHPGALPVQGSILLSAADGLVFFTAQEVSAESTTSSRIAAAKAAADAIVLDATDPAGAISLRTDGTERARITSQGVLAALGSPGAPSVSFLGATTTGLFGAAAEVGVSISGTSRVRFTATDVRPSTDGITNLGTASLRWADAYVGRVLVGNGTAGAPSIALASDTDTGIYGGPAVINFALSGFDVFSISNTGIRVYTTLKPNASGARNLGEDTARWGRAFLAGGTVALPSISIGADDDGLYQPAADTLGVTIAGTERARVDTTGILPATDGVEALGKWATDGSERRWASVVTQRLQVGTVLAGGLGIAEPALYSIETGHAEVDGSLSPVTIWSHALQPEEAMYVVAKMIGRDGSTGEDYFFIRAARAQRDSLGAGGAVTIGTTQSMVTDSENANVNAVFALNGTTLELRITDGVGSIDAQFSFTVEKQFLGSF